ncbi:MAG: diadenylate cyclase CdaA [Lachnospiraceae bacterium]|nr:diadenylate cyclase CdaA [Lachnospiraceae bacterium]
MTRLKLGDILEILIIAMIIYYFLRWIKTTNAWAVLKGLIMLFLCWLIAYIFDLHAIQWLFVNAVGVGITALVILFQPELRRVLEQIGQKGFAPSFFSGSVDQQNLTDKDIEEIVTAVYKMAKEKTGALIVFERQIGLQGMINSGIILDAEISSQLLLIIFEEGLPLHDGAVIVRGRRLIAATCYLPLSSNMQLDKEMGTRHRAAVGVSEETDSFTVVVSEETGTVSITRNGEIIRGISGDRLKKELHGLKTVSEKKKRFPFKKQKEQV